MTFFVAPQKTLASKFDPQVDWLQIFGFVKFFDLLLSSKSSNLCDMSRISFKADSSSILMLASAPIRVPSSEPEATVAVVDYRFNVELKGFLQVQLAPSQYYNVDWFDQHFQASVHFPLTSADHSDNLAYSLPLDSINSKNTFKISVQFTLH